MALDHALLDRIVVFAVVDQIPGAVRDLAGVVGRRALPQPVDELQLERLDLVRRVAGSHPRQRLAGRLLPHPGGHQQSVSQRDRIHLHVNPKHLDDDASRARPGSFTIRLQDQSGALIWVRSNASKARSPNTTLSFGSTCAIGVTR